MVGPGWFSRVAEGGLRQLTPSPGNLWAPLALSLSVQVPGHVANRDSQGAAGGTASWEPADAADHGEKMVRQ